MSWMRHQPATKLGAAQVLVQQMPGVAASARLERAESSTNGFVLHKATVVRTGWAATMVR
jgi:hypothetical protein